MEPIMLIPHNTVSWFVISSLTLFHSYFNGIVSVVLFRLYYYAGISSRLPQLIDAKNSIPFAVLLGNMSKHRQRHCSLLLHSTKCITHI